MKDLIEVILSFALGFTYGLIFLALGGPKEILGLNTLFVFGAGNTILAALADGIRDAKEDESD